MREAWALRLKERAEQKSKGRLTPSQVESQFKLLVRLVGVKGRDYAVFCVERATAAHHQGIVFNEDFAEERGGRRGGQPSGSQTRLFQPPADDDSEEVRVPRKRFGEGG
jgi:hypothetical protein